MIALLCMMEALAEAALFPSPLVGEGGENERSEFAPGEGLAYR
jgi:hypothetical protein